MNHLLVLLPSLLGFVLLALSMARQQEDVFGSLLPRKATYGLRTAGWAALALALFVAVRGQGWALGLVSYSGHTSLAAGLVLCALIVHARAKGRR